MTWICDHCKRAIRRGEPYSVTELGRLHSACQRAACQKEAQLVDPWKTLRGKRVLSYGGYYVDPIYALRRA